MKYINRNIQNTITKLMKTFKVVIVTGARQTGKSTLLQEMFPKMKYISLDDPFIEDQANNSTEMFMMGCQPCCIIDEVQYAPNIFRYIKIECDKSTKNGLYILTGSQPFRLMQIASDSLAGRAAILELATLSLSEITKSECEIPFVPTLDYIKKRQNYAKDPKQLWNIIHRGFYPKLQDENVDWQTFYASYTKTYLERDVRDLEAVQDLGTFRKFMIACAARTGQILNYTNIANEVEIDVTTVKRWVSVLEASGVVYLLEPFSNSALKRAIKSPKLYFRDTGLAAYLTRWTTAETLSNGAQNGAFFETFVISEILKSFSNLGMDYRYFVSYYRGRDKIKTQKNGVVSNKESEIDFIIEENGVLHPVEIKRSSKVSADEAAAFKVLDKINEKKRGMGAIVCPCAIPGKLRENILQIPYWYI